MVEVAVSRKGSGRLFQEYKNQKHEKIKKLKKALALEAFKECYYDFYDVRRIK